MLHDLEIPGLGIYPRAKKITLSGKESACQCRRHWRLGFDPWVRKIPWRRKSQPTPVFLPGEFLGQRNLMGYSPWGHKESDTTEHACMREKENIHLQKDLYICSYQVYSYLSKIRNHSYGHQWRTGLRKLWYIHTAEYCSVFLKKQTVSSYSNIDESQEHVKQKEAGHKASSIMWLHLCEVQKQERLVYADRNQQVVDGDRQGLDWKQIHVNFLRYWGYLFSG